MIKKFIMAILIILAMGSSVYADTDIGVGINGTAVEFTDTKPR